MHPSAVRGRPGARGCLLRGTLSWSPLDRLARSLPDARDIVDVLTSRDVKLNIGGSMHDPTDPVGRLLYNVLAMVAEFESDLIRMRTREGMKVAKAKGRLRGKQPKLNPKQQAHLVNLHGADDHTSAELAELFRVTRSTAYRTKRAERSDAAARAEKHRPPTPRRDQIRSVAKATPRALAATPTPLPPAPHPHQSLRRSIKEARVPHVRRARQRAGCSRRVG